MYIVVNRRPTSIKTNSLTTRPKFFFSFGKKIIKFHILFCSPVLTGLRTSFFGSSSYILRFLRFNFFLIKFFYLFSFFLLLLTLFFNLFLPFIFSFVFFI